jgi:preprotein translocase subunit SecG
MIDTMLQTILLVAMILISVALTAVILLQRSEGGALGMGGGPSGFMTARGAGNLLTRATSVLAVLFFVCAISLTIAGNFARGSRSVIDADAVGAIAVGNEQTTASAEQAAPTPAAPVAPSLDDLEASLPAAAAPAPTQAPAPAQ